MANLITEGGERITDGDREIKRLRGIIRDREVVCGTEGRVREIHLLVLLYL